MTFDEQLDKVLIKGFGWHTCEIKYPDNPLLPCSFCEAKTAIKAAADADFYRRVQRHATYNVPITNLDKDPTGETVEYDECYILPKKWVDETEKGLGL